MWLFKTSSHRVTFIFIKFHQNRSKLLLIAMGKCYLIRWFSGIELKLNIHLPGESTFFSTDSIYKCFTGVTQFTSEHNFWDFFSPESSDLLEGRGRGVLILKDKGLKFKCWFKLSVKIKENLPWREWVDVHFLDITSVDCTLRSLRKKSRHLLIKGM